MHARQPVTEPGHGAIWLVVHIGQGDGLGVGRKTVQVEPIGSGQDREA